MQKITRGLSIVWALALTTSAVSAQTVWYVKGSAPAGGNGASWSTPFRSLRSALDLAVSGDQVWVAAGMYSVRDGSLADPRTAEFFVKPGLALYGGFAGNESSIAQRAGLFSATVLSGDLGVLGDPSDNAYHVVRTWGAATIDGFAIVDANAVDSGAPAGAIFCDIGSVGGQPPLFQGSGLTLRNCTVARNTSTRGAALYGQLANLKVSLCTFENNTATGLGGAISLQTSVARFDLCTFRRNHAGNNGGAVHLASIALTPAGRPRVEFYNCLFHDNDALGSGGVAYLGGSQFSSGNGAFTNCTLALNQAGVQGGAICAVTTTQVKARAYLENSIVWSNRAPTDADLGGTQWVWYSIAPGQTGTAVLNAAPHFVSIAQRDFRLRPNSPAIDAGSNALRGLDPLDVDGDGALLEFAPFDLALQPRLSGAQIDMGAYEH
jgi:predicted outer membrane repeat protein